MSFSKWIYIIGTIRGSVTWSGVECDEWDDKCEEEVFLYDWYKLIRDTFYKVEDEIDDKLRRLEIMDLATNTVRTAGFYEVVIRDSYKYVLNERLDGKRDAFWVTYIGCVLLTDNPILIKQLKSIPIPVTESIARKLMSDIEERWYNVSKRLKLRDVRNILERYVTANLGSIQKEVNKYINASREDILSTVRKLDKSNCLMKVIVWGYDPDEDEILEVEEEDL